MKKDAFKQLMEELMKNQYKRRLLMKILSCFVWEGAEIDSRSLNLQLFIQGGAGIIKDGKLGYITMVARDGGNPTALGFGDKIIGMSLDGKTKVNGLAYWNDKISDKDNCAGVICFNDSMGNGVLDIIERYATALEIADTSINIAMKNTRVSPLISASTQTARDQIQLALDQIYDGKPHVFYDGFIANGMSENPLNELLTAIRTTTNIADLIEMRADLYSRFCIEIGIPVVNNTKRSQLISGEIGGISTLSLVNLKDMLERRKEFCNRFNELFGENLTVRIADEYLIETMDESEGLNEGSSEEESEGSSEGSNSGSDQEGDDE